MSSRKINIASVAGKMARMLKPRAENAGLNIKFEALDELCDIFFDENALEQVFFILTQNAIEASDGGDSKELIISGKQQGENVLMSFSDNCGGVDPEVAARCNPSMGK